MVSIPCFREEKASFSQPLDNVTQAVSGDDVALTCRVRGQVAKVTWELNNKPVSGKII